MGRFDGRDGPLRVRYEPTSVKDLLVEMKDTAELLIDLSYSAVLHGARRSPTRSSNSNTEWTCSRCARA